MASEAIRVKGLRDLQRAFALADKEESKLLTGALRHAAEPVRTGAEGLAISHMKVSRIPWFEMRIGVTSKSVYVAPKRRAGRGRAKRRNFADILMNDAMSPALAAQRSQVEHSLDEMLGEVGRKWERA